MATQQYRQTEQTIRSVLGLLSGPAFQRLRVMVTDGAVYVDGRVPEYSYKRAITRLLARVARPSKVVNRVRVCPASLSP